MATERGPRVSDDSTLQVQPPPSSPAPPRTQIEIDFGRRLGRGTYGTVYATDSPLVACKIFSNNTHFVNELAAYNALQGSPYVPRIHRIKNSYLKSGRLYMERFDSDLTPAQMRKFFASGLSRSQLKQVAYLLLRAVADVHARGLVHLDFKPANILLKMQPLRVVIVDWGSSKIAGPLDYSPHYPYQTLWYRAPEFLLCSGCYGQPADLWSLGCILYELFADRPFVGAANETEQLVGILQRLGTPPQLAQLGLPDFEGRGLVEDLALEELLLGLLNLDPRQRWTATRALEHPFWEDVRGLKFSLPWLPPVSRLPPAPVLPEPLRSNYRQLLAGQGEVNHVSAHAMALSLRLLESCLALGGWKKPELLPMVCLQLASLVCDTSCVRFCRTPASNWLLHGVVNALWFNLMMLDELPAQASEVSAPMPVLVNEPQRVSPAARAIIHSRLANYPSRARLHGRVMSSRDVSYMVVSCPSPLFYILEDEYLLTSEDLEHVAPALAEDGWSHTLTLKAYPKLMVLEKVKTLAGLQA